MTNREAVSLGGLRLLGVLAVLVSSGAAEAQQRLVVLPQQWFERVREISLYENDEVINVSPAVHVDLPRQLFVVVDSREARARIYRFNGTLVKQFGKKGRGPGEFQSPRSGVRLPSGALLIADIGRGVIVFDEQGDSSLGGARPPVTPLYSIAALSDESVLVAGPRYREGGGPPLLLHVWNLKAQRIERSFFPQPGEAVAQRAARNFGWVTTATRQDTIAAVSALTDTVYLLGRDGTILQQVPLPFREFRRVSSYSPVETSNPLRRTQWLERLDFISHLFWLDDGTFLVQYERPRGAGSAWNLLWMTRSGERIFDLTETPKLLAVARGQLYFVHPESETPNRWLVARLKRLP